jgi:signal transduction histidine kinase
MVFPHGELLFVTIGYIVSMMVGLGLGLFVLSRRARGAHLFFFLMCLSLAGYQLSFILGANAADPNLAYNYWLANIVDVFLALFYLHFIILALDAMPKFRVLLTIAYAAGLSIFAVACFFPHAFLPAVVPKLYFPFYLTPGPLYFVMFAYFSLAWIASFAVMFVSWRTLGTEGRRRVEYYFFSALYGCASGFTAFALVFNIPLDPIPSVLLGTFTVPMVYGMMRKDLLDIRIVVRRTLVFTFAVAGIAGLFTTVSLLSQYIAPLVPWFFFLVPVIAALAAVGVGYIYWSKANEAERLKYEFLTVVAHKFRTPLTRIRWAAEAMREDRTLTEDSRRLLATMLESDLLLISLSNLLIDAVRMEKETYAYVEKDIDVSSVIHAAVATYRSAIQDKGVTYTESIAPALPIVRADPERLAAVLGVFIENAIAYTPAGGSIRISATGSSDTVRVAVTDTGLGIDADEAPYIFKKFFRGADARRADTEGVGVGLSMAKAIIERERGSIGAESPGRGKGSEFWFTLPAQQVKGSH